VELVIYYSIIFGLTGRFLRYYPEATHVRVEEDSSTPRKITRKEFAQILLTARRDRDKSVVRWDTRPNWRRPTLGRWGR
jgi:hypothetical protein